MRSDRKQIDGKAMKSWTWPIELVVFVIVWLVVLGAAAHGQTGPAIVRVQVSTPDGCSPPVRKTRPSPQLPHLS